MSYELILFALSFYSRGSRFSLIDLLYEAGSNANEFSTRA